MHDLFSENRLMIGENWAFFDKIDFETKKTEKELHGWGVKIIKEIDRRIV